MEHGTPLPARVRSVAADYDRDTGGRVLVVDSTGRAVLDTAPTESRDFSSRSEVDRALRGEIATGTRRSRTLGADLLFVAVPVASSGVVHGAVRITYPMSAVDARIHRYWSVLALIALAVLGVAVVIAFALARWVVRPLVGLERAADALGGGELDARAPVAGPPEVRRLAETFNAMADRLDVLVHSQDEFVADASHQLRTPLAALRLRLENLERDVRADGSSELDGALAEVERLSALVDALLVLARADRASAAPSRVDIGDVARDRLAAFAAYGGERGVGLDESIEPDVVGLATSGRLEQVLDNLLANALDHSPPGTAVTVSVRRRGAQVEVTVADEGPGMEADAIPRAFDRFWRADGAGDGFGLGLAIASRLVRADGGAVELRSRDGRGLEAIVTLRAASDVEEPARSGV
jgi:signal transduction histidine kinase